ncbi:MAG TPA: hypothetical protein DCE56_14525 [Cyanobacteria bacterium UBA8553]|nr:hypothetical protein [Cyanobacteria bacterium UBA8553]
MQVRENPTAINKNTRNIALSGNLLCAENCLHSKQEASNMRAKKFFPPIWVSCPQEGLRIRIAIESELLGTVTDGEQLPTLTRYF